MHPLRLLRLAVQAECVRYRALGRRLAVRAVVFGFAAIFLLAALVFGHVAAWFWLGETLRLSPLAASGLIAGTDLLIALILAWSAARSRPGPIETEAVAVRRQAVIGLRGHASLVSAAVPLLRILARVINRKTVETPPPKTRSS